MSTVATPRAKPIVTYPDSDGQPMADNTVQFRWIQTLQGGLDVLFREDRNVFVAGDLLWYPVEGNIDEPDGWASPRLGVRFDLSSGTLRVLDREGRPLPTFIELAEREAGARQQTERERHRAEQERQRAEQLAAQLRALGVDPAA